MKIDLEPLVYDLKEAEEELQWNAAPCADRYLEGVCKSHVALEQLEGSFLRNGSVATMERTKQ